jgi:hypothetical protein
VTFAEVAVIATQRTTSNKRDREKAKRERAAAKRERRAARSSDASEMADEFVDDGETADGVMQHLKALHDQYEHGKVSFEDFDVEKGRLLARLAKGFGSPD